MTNRSDSEVPGGDDAPAIEPGGAYRKLNLAERNFARADLEDASLFDCTLSHASLLNARGNGARFERCDLSGVRLAGCNPFGASFVDSKLLGVETGASTPTFAAQT